MPASTNRGFPDMRCALPRRRRDNRSPDQAGRCRSPLPAVSGSPSSSRNDAGPKPSPRCALSQRLRLSRESPRHLDTLRARAGRDGRSRSSRRKPAATAVPAGAARLRRAGGHANRDRQCASAAAPIFERCQVRWACEPDERQPHAHDAVLLHPLQDVSLDGGLHDHRAAQARISRTDSMM